MNQETVGEVLRSWRQKRRFSQLDLACEAEISTRHLSFVESGRSLATRDMLLKLAGPLAMPLRERNRLLLAGGYAPMHPERSLEAFELSAARDAVAAVLKGHEPFPALAVDRHWNMVDANAGIAPLLFDVAQHLLEPPVNVLRLSLHPEGLASRIVNLAEWRHHLLRRLRGDFEASGDVVLSKLLAELSAFPTRPPTSSPKNWASVAVPLVLRDPRSGTTMSFTSTTTIFGTAVDVTLSELTLECFFPADESTREVLRGTRGL